MNTKSTIFYDDDIHIRVYRDSSDDQYYLESSGLRIWVTEEIGKAFEKLDDIRKGKICPKCGCKIKTRV